MRRVTLLATFITVLAVGTVRAEPGVTVTAIRLGQSAALSGPAAALGTEMRLGANVYFRHVNEHGGVHGRKIELLSLDDGYEPARTVPNTRRLIEEERVFALFGYVGTPTSYAVLPLIERARIPFIAPFTGAEGLRTPFNRYIFNVRASYFDETERHVEYLLANRKKRIAVFYQNDSYGKAGLEGVERAMARRNLGIVATGTVERNTTDVAAAVATIVKARPDAIIMVSAYKSCAAFIRETNAAVRGETPLYVNVSFVGSNALAHELGTDGQGVIVSQVVPYPWDPTVPVAMEFQRLLQQYRIPQTPTFTSLEGFIAAKALVAGLENAGRDLTREKLIAALETARHIDVGGVTLQYSPDSHNGSSSVQMTVIIGASGKFLLLDGPADRPKTSIASRRQDARVASVP